MNGGQRSEFREALNMLNRPSQRTYCESTFNLSIEAITMVPTVSTIIRWESDVHNINREKNRSLHNCVFCMLFANTHLDAPWWLTLFVSRFERCLAWHGAKGITSRVEKVHKVHSTHTKCMQECELFRRGREHFCTALV